MKGAISNRKIAVEDLPRYTVEEWAQWEGNWELIEGIPYAMAPMPSKKHQRLNGRLYRLLSEELEKCGDCEAFLPVNFKIDDFNLFHPDLMVVCQEPEEGIFVTKIPSLVLEILLPSTQKKDEETKPKVYQALQIKYYLIVDPKLETVSIFQLDKSVYSLLKKARDFTLSFEFGDCTISLDFSKIW